MTDLSTLRTLLHQVQVHDEEATPQLAAVVEAVLRVHRPLGIYAHEDECENPDDKHREERHREYVDMMGEFYCEDLREYTGCPGCKDAADLDQWSDWPQYPCPTVRAMLAALGGRRR